MARLDPELHFLLNEYERGELTNASSPPFTELNATRTRQAGNRLFRINVQFTGSVAELETAGMQVGTVVGPVAYGQVALASLRKLASLDTVITIDQQRPKQLGLDKSVPDVRGNLVRSRSGNTFTGNTGEGVIIGIVDTGIDFEHLNFRKSTGDTRLLRLWDQTLTVATGEHSPGPVAQPSGSAPLGYGVEYTDEQINTYLHNPPITPPVRHQDQDGHGTHVAGIAAGSGAQSGGCHLAYHYVGIAPAADLVIVRMAGLTTGDNTSALPATSDPMLDGILYILNVAKTLPQPKPVVINLSLGSYTSLMDGTGGDSVAIDALLQANSAGLTVVFCAGNDGASNYHARATVPAGPVASLPIKFRVAQQDSKSRQLIVRYTGSNLQVKLTSLAGTTNWVPLGGAVPAGNIVNGLGTLSISNQMNRISVFIAPPSTPPVAPATTPVVGNNVAGDWTIELQDTTSVSTTIDAFCVGDMNNATGSMRFLDHATVQTTLWEQATGREVIAVGSYSAENGNLAASSARGMTLDLRQKPEITAPGVGIQSTANAKFRAEIRHDETCDCCVNCCCTCCQDFYKSLSGTSMAAPHVTGTVALLFQKDKTLTHTQVLKHLVSTARKVTTSVVDDQMGWGMGKLDVKAAVDPAPAPTPDPAAPTPITALPQSHTDLLQDRVMRNPRWPEFRLLYDRYADEVWQTINTNKRVATVWHRCGGPAWVRVALQLASMPTMPIPTAAGGCTLSDGVARMRAIFERYGSAALVQEINRCVPDIEQVESGMSILQLLALFEQPRQTNPVPTT